MTSLVGSIVRYVSTGIEAGEATVVVAAKEHIGAIERSLGDAIDLPSARASGFFRLLVAEHLLDMFMDDGSHAPTGSSARSAA